MNRIVTAFGLSAFLSMGLLACGGGSGDGGDTGLTYNGSTSPVRITQTNAEELLASAYSEPQESRLDLFPGGLLEAASMDGSASREMGVSHAARLLDTVLSVTPRHTPFPGAGDSRVVAASMMSEAMMGSCGGSATFSGDADEQNGRFDGTFSFNSYCEEGVVLNGAMRISGTASDTAMQMTLTFDHLRATEMGYTYTTNGTMVMSGGASGATVTMDLVMSDEQTGEMVWMQNLRMVVNEGSDMGGSYATFTLTGRIYHSEEGYVDITTPEPFKAYDLDYYPVAGTLLVSGADGTSARMMVGGSGSCTIEADTTGDGAFDYNETISCDSLYEM